MSKHPAIRTISSPSVKTASSSAGLVELLDRVLDKGVVVSGDVILSIADVDLIGLNLKLFLASIERVRMGGFEDKSFSKKEEALELAELKILREELEKATQYLPTSVKESPKEAGLAKLALTIIELLKGLMEKQAMRRVEGGSLRDEEIEKMGLTFQLLEKRLEVLRKTFGLKKEDLNIDLGPMKLI